MFLKEFDCSNEVIEVISEFCTSHPWAHQIELSTVWKQKNNMEIISQIVWFGKTLMRNVWVHTEISDFWMQKTSLQIWAQFETLVRYLLKLYTGFLCEISVRFLEPFLRRKSKNSILSVCYLGETTETLKTFFLFYGRFLTALLHMCHNHRSLRPPTQNCWSVTTSTGGFQASDSLWLQICKRFKVLKNHSNSMRKGKSRPQL